MGRRVLLVEDDELVRHSLARAIAREGCEVLEARDGGEATDLIDRGEEVGLILTDLEMPRMGGREVLQLGLRKKVPVVVLTGHASVETAVDLMRMGAANFLAKPIDGDALREVLEEAFGRRPAPRPASSPRGVADQVVGDAPGFRRVLETVAAVADSDASVLITGESGTGKELVARMIHAASPRARKPFVAVNCGALPDTLLESELFGHARGSFTGATHARIGRFQAADGGTLFLDEIGDMPPAFQVKLLRVLQEGQFDVLGESTPRTVDVRMISATHRDLQARIDEGHFREDLYYRLNVVELRMPSLRERREDIPALVEHLIGAANARHGRHVTGVSDEVMAAFMANRWPGNIRQLSNVVERMVVLKRQGRLEAADLDFGPEPSASAAAGESARALPPEGIDLRQAVADLEHSLIEQALSRTGGNRNAAAQLLGLNRTTLVEKLRRKR